MRRVMFSVLVGMLLAVVAVGPVAAGSRQAVTMTVTTAFESDPDPFTAIGLAGCEGGWVFDGPAHVQFTPAPGVFAGFKVFECDADTGFVVRLNVRFGVEGAIGTWAVVAAWGDLAGMTGAGSLTGDPIEGGIIDTYIGSVVL